MDWFQPKDLRRIYAFAQTQRDPAAADRFEMAHKNDRTGEYEKVADASIYYIADAWRLLFDMCSVRSGTSTSVVCA